MTADLIIKNANVFMTYRQCFEKRYKLGEQK